MTDFEDSRSILRFVLHEPMDGYFGAIAIRVVDVSVRGVQIEHADPLKPRQQGRLGVRSSHFSVSGTGVVAWSRISKNTNSEGKLLYRSGIAITEIAGLDAAIDTLRRLGKISPDSNSIERKRRKLMDREDERKKTPRLITTPVQIPPDHLLLVQQARERLITNPGEAMKWYNRARYSMAEESHRLQELHLPYKEEVFAVWEYLDRTIDLVTIARAFDQKKM